MGGDVQPRRSDLMGPTFDACLAERARDAPGVGRARGRDRPADVRRARGARRPRSLPIWPGWTSGLEPRVVLVAENSVAHLATAFAIWRAGATLVTVYPSSSAAEFEYALAHSRPALVVAGESVLPTVGPVARQLDLPLVTLAATGRARRSARCGAATSARRSTPTGWR